MTDNADKQQNSSIQHHQRYAMISEMAYLLGEERRKNTGHCDPMRDWIEAEAAIDGIIPGS